MKNEEAITCIKMMFAFWANTHKLNVAQMEAAKDLAIAALGNGGFIETSKMVPLTLEQLRGMDGKPVWVTPTGFWALVIAKKGKRVQLICNDGERVWADKEIELVGPVYAYPPAHIDREAWTAEWVKRDGYTECSKCEYWYDSPESEDEGDRPVFCPGCGRAMKPQGLAILEKRLRG